MALFKSKLPLLDPLLKVYVVIENDIHPNWAKYSNEKIFSKIIGLDKKEQLVLYDKNYLPLEYQYQDLIGLKLRELTIFKKLRFNLQTTEIFKAIELLVGERKLVFLADNLVKIA